MNIITIFKDDTDAPVTGLTPKISITDITDITSPVLIINAVSMIEISLGFYGYDFSGYTKETKYSVYIDADSPIDYRYQYGTIGSDVEITREAVWDELLTGNLHNLPASAGRRLRNIAQNVITTGTATGGTINTISLNGDSSTNDGAYDPAQIAIINGTGYGQCRGIFEYYGATRTAIIDRNWKTIPDETSEYVITTWPGREHVNEGLSRGGTINTIVLNERASSFDNKYNGQLIFIRSGTGQDQIGVVKDYDGTTKTATLYLNWDVIPDTTSVYNIIPFHYIPEETADYIWSQDITNYLDKGEAGNALLSMFSSDYNTVKILDNQDGTKTVTIYTVDGPPNVFKEFKVTKTSILEKREEI